MRKTMGDGGAWALQQRDELRKECDKLRVEVSTLKSQLEGVEALERINEDGYERDIATLRAENERLRAALKDVVRWHDGTHAEDCHAYGTNDEDVESNDVDNGEPHCECGATEKRNSIRAMLRSEAPKEDGR